MNWSQEDNKVIVTSPIGSYFFVMPEGFNIKNVHPDLIKLTEMVLFLPWFPNLKDYKFTRNKGSKIALSFSGGADSMAAQCLLPKDTILFYHRRALKPGLLKHDNPLYVFESNNLDVKIIESNHEDIRTNYNLMTGFSTDLAPCAAAILLADYWDLGYLATGTMLESTYIYKGYVYRDFSKVSYWQFWFKCFKDAGLEIFFPVMPCSEVLNMKILKQNNRMSISCIRGERKPCNKCYKCYRKSCINGIQPELCQEAKKILQQRPLKQGASLIYSVNKFNLNVPELNSYKLLQLNWLEDYYEQALELIPDDYKAYLKTELEKYAKPMDERIKYFDIGFDVG